MKNGTKVRHKKYGKGVVVKQAVLPQAVLVHFFNQDEGMCRTIAIAKLVALDS